MKQTGAGGGDKDVHVFQQCGLNGGRGLVPRSVYVTALSVVFLKVDPGLQVSISDTVTQLAKTRGWRHIRFRDVYLR